MKNARSQTCECVGIQYALHSYNIIIQENTYYRTKVFISVCLLIISLLYILLCMHTARVSLTHH